MHPIKYIFTLLCAFNFLIIEGQVSSYTQFEHLSTDNGLSYNEVSCILQDQDGFMWFGTKDGLNMYDGYNFYAFSNISGDTTSLSDNNITAIIEDHLGFIWVGTQNGLNKFDKNTGKFVQYLNNANNEESLTNNHITSLYTDDMTFLWIGTKGGGLNKFIRHKNNFRHYYFGDKTNFRQNTITSIVNFKIESTNHLLVTTDYGVALFNTVKEIECIKDFSQYQFSFTASLIHKDKIWLGTWQNGLFQFDINTLNLTKITNTAGNKNFPINAFHLNAENELWIATEMNGIMTFDMRSNTFIKNLKTIEVNDYTITNIYLSKNDILWISAANTGIYKYIKKRSKTIFNNEYIGNNINTIAIDKNNNFILGTNNNGLIFSANTTPDKLIKDPLNKLPFTSITAIHQVDYNNQHLTFVGSKSNGFYIINNNTIEFIHSQNKNELYNPGFIFSFFLDGDNLWIGTWDRGLFCYNLKRKTFQQWTKESTNGALSSNIILSIKQDKNILWLGTKSGLNKVDISDLNNLKFKSYLNNPNDINSLSNNSIANLLIDNEDIIWIATLGGGINKFDTKREVFTSYNKSNELPSNNIMNVIKDDKNNLWCPTNNGLAKFNTATLTATNYYKSDGFLTNVFTGASFQKDGKLYFGTTDGLVSFYPDSLINSINTAIPPIAITNVRLVKTTKGNMFNQMYDKRIYTKYDVIELNYNQNDFTIEFSALDYINPNKNKYKYILEGYDNEWVSTDAKHRYATYTNLPHGLYTFRVIGSNNDNIWNENGTFLTIKITPPFWKTTLFQLIIALVLGFLAILLLSKLIKKQRLNRLLFEEEAFAKENQLKTLINNLPDFVYIKDVDSRFILANQMLAETMKLSSPDKLIGLTDHDFYQKELADQFYNDEQQIMKTGITMTNRVEPGMDKKGKEIIVSTTKVPIKNPNGDIIGIVGIGRDITEIKNAEKQIIEFAETLQETNVLLEERQEEIVQQKEEIEFQKEELEKLNATKDKFFSIIGHDLKNPFHAITTLAEILLNEYDKKEKQEKIEMISMIKESSENAFNLLQNLLNWSKTQSKKIDFQPENVNIKELVEQTVVLLKPYAERKNIRLHAPINNNVEIYADENMVLTIIRNLINNAIKFTQNNGEVKIGVIENLNEVQVIVSDTGIGIDEKTLNKLFKIDEHQSTTGTAGESGTGLGLIICREFVEKHKGRIEIQSKQGIGSTFSVVFPR